MALFSKDYESDLKKSKFTDQWQRATKVVDLFIGERGLSAPNYISTWRAQLTGVLNMIARPVL